MIFPSEFEANVLNEESILGSLLPYFRLFKNDH